MAGDVHGVKCSKQVPVVELSSVDEENKRNVEDSDHKVDWDKDDSIPEVHF